MIFVILQSGLIYRIRADPFNFVHGIRVGLQQKIRVGGEGCQLEIYFEKTMGGASEGGYQPK